MSHLPTYINWPLKRLHSLTIKWIGLLLFLPLLCQAQNPITTRFFSEGELSIRNSSQNSLHIELKERGRVIFSEVILPNSSKSVSNAFSKASARHSNIYYTYDQNAYWTDIRLIKKELQAAIQERNQEQFLIAIWKGLDQALTGGKGAEGLSIYENFRKGRRGDLAGLAEDYLQGMVESEVVKRASSGTYGVEKKLIEGFVVAGISLIESAKQTEFPQYQAKAERCLNRLKNEGFIGKGGESIWDMSSNRSVLNASTPPILFGFKIGAILNEEADRPIHTFKGSTAKPNLGLSLAFPLSPSHRLGAAHARLYGVAAFETQSFEVQTDFLVALQKFDGTNYRTVAGAYNGGKNPPSENKLIIQNQSVAFGGRYMLFLKLPIFYVEGGMMKNVANAFAVDADAIVQFDKTDNTLKPGNEMPDLPGVMLFDKNGFSPYARMGFAAKMPSGNRWFIAPFLEGTYYWKGLSVGTDYRVARLVETTPKMVTATPVANPGKFWSVSFGFKFGF